MTLAPFGTDSWLKKPADHAIIERWTVGGKESSHALELPPPSDPERFSFLILGDSGDSEFHAHGLSPQDAVAREMAVDCGLGRARPSPTLNAQHATLILHTGDLVYMTGEKRLYDRNFRRPYADFLTPESTVENLVFRIPFLPVPGNHDYYDLGSWAMWLSRIPFVGDGLRALTRQLFAFNMPEGGSQMGKAYMSAFVNLHADTAHNPFSYAPAGSTRLPNRYYRFTHGIVDFFALDSNTLDAPPAWQGPERIRAEAEDRAEALEKKARRMDSELRRLQSRCDSMQEVRLNVIASDSASLRRLLIPAEALARALDGLSISLQSLPRSINAAEASEEAEDGARAWKSALARVRSADSAADSESALRELNETADQACAPLRDVEAVLARLPESPERTLLLAARDDVEIRRQEWTEALDPIPDLICQQIHALSEKALDVQRELALEKRRVRYRPDDHDSAQLEWLDKALAESVGQRPDNWRVVYLHHPLYTSIGNHCERPDVVDVRENLMDIIRDRVHLIFSGHSHAFEWFRSERLPNTGIFVTGGGGQISLRPSILSPRRLPRHRAGYERLRNAGVRECAFAGYGSSPLYHFLRADVSAESLSIRPVGIRASMRALHRESPMPAHLARLDAGKPVMTETRIDSIRVYRSSPPEVVTVP